MKKIKSQKFQIIRRFYKQRAKRMVPKKSKLNLTSPKVKRKRWRWLLMMISRIFLKWLNIKENVMAWKLYRNPWLVSIITFIIANKTHSSTISCRTTQPKTLTTATLSSKLASIEALWKCDFRLRQRIRMTFSHSRRLRRRSRLREISIRRIICKGKWSGINPLIRMSSEEGRPNFNPSFSAIWNPL